MIIRRGGNTINNVNKVINTEIGRRLKKVRTFYGLSQDEFSKKIIVAQSTLASFELGERRLKDIYIDAISSKFNVNHIWLKTGVGEMFNNVTEYSLDEYADLHRLTSLELDIIKTYMEIDEQARKELLDKFSSLFFNYKILSEIENQKNCPTGYDDSTKLTSPSDIIVKDKESLYVVEVKNYIQDVGRASREKNK